MKLRTAAATLVLGAAPLLAQTPQRPPTFEVGIEVINLNLSVTDGRNNYVTDLAEKDFAVFEDGIRQELSFYTHENLPISMAVMIDVSASMDEKLPQARAAALRLLKTLRAQDPAQDRQRLAFSQAEYLLTALSRDTGGRVFFPNSLSELDSVYDQIAEELRTQYSLGYVSSNRRRDGKWRRIVVRTPTREELQIRHKLGYYAPAS